MINFILYGIALNVYSTIVLYFIIKAIYPKGYKSPYTKQLPIAFKIAIMFVPYLVFILGLFVILVLVVCKFDYKEFEKFRKIVDDKEKTRKDKNEW